MSPSRSMSEVPVATNGSGLQRLRAARSRQVSRSRPAETTHASPSTTAMPKGRTPTLRIVAPTRTGFGVAVGCGLEVAVGSAARSRCPPSPSSSTSATTAAATIRAAAASTGPGRGSARDGALGAAVARQARGGARRAPEVARRRVALGRVLGERAQHDRVELGGQLPARLGRPRRRIREVGPELGLVGLALERDAAGEHEVQDAAERVDVGAGVDALAADLLWRDVVERADPLLRARLAAARERLLREPEVAQVDVPGRIHHHVLRLDVAMHVAGPVDRVEGVAEPHRDARRPLRLQRALGAYDGAQVAARDVAHHEIRAPLRDPDAVDGDDVGMLYRAGGTRLGEEALADLRILDQLRRDHLQRDVAVEVELMRAIYDPHAASADDSVDPATSEHRARSQLPHGAVYS